MIYMAVRKMPEDGDMEEFEYPQEVSVSATEKGCREWIEKNARWTPKFHASHPVVRIGRFNVVEIIEEGDKS